MSEGGNSLSEASRRSLASRLRSRLRKLVGRYRNVIRVGLIVGAAVTDLAVIAISGMLVALIRQGDLASSSWVQTVVLLLPTYLLAAFALRAYEMRSLRSLSRALMATEVALATAAAIGFTLAFALKVSVELSRLETGFTIILAAILLAVARVVGTSMLRRLFRSVIDQHVVVLTDGGTAARYSRDATTSLIDVRQLGIFPSLTDPAFFNRIGSVGRDADRVILAFGDRDERLKWAEAMRLSGLDAELIADVGDIQPIGLSTWRHHSTLVISRGPLNLWERLIKRALDLSVTLALLLVCGPIIGVFALLVKLDSPGPAFFAQPRVGRNNRTYKCYKLRTMRTDLSDQMGGVSTARDDNRITELGGFLRRTSIDELPQLWNVLRGEMSLVGPRPHALGSRAEGALFWELVPDYWSRHAMKPGVTGLAQVRGFRGATVQRTDLEHRVAADLEYINGWSLWLDIKILLMTARVVVHHNAF